MQDGECWGRPGWMSFALRNASGKRGTFVIAVLPLGFVPGHTRLEFVPHRKACLLPQTSRDLFRSEVIRASDGIGSPTSRSCSPI